MKNQIAKITLLGLLTSALVAVPSVTRAADSTNAPAMAAPAKKAGTAFHGKIAAVDTAAMTITVGELTISATSATKITKDGKPATLSDLTVGETVAGSYKKDDAGKLNATGIHAGDKAPKKKKAAPAVPAAN